jgi:hypothetical protein
MNYWRIVNRKVVPSTRRQWCEFFASPERLIKQETVGDFWVSTVFLGIDHNFSGDGPPVLFETIVFGEPEEQDLLGRKQQVRPSLQMDRYCTLDEAEAGHEQVVQQLRQQLDQAERLTLSVLARIKTSGDT